MWQLTMFNGSHKKKTCPKLFAPDLQQIISQKRSKKGGRQGVFFLSWTQFWHQGLPIELWGDFKEHFDDFNKIRNSFYVFFATRTNNIEKERSKKWSEKHYARALNDNSFRNKAGWHTHTHTHTLTPIQRSKPSAVAGLGEALWFEKG